MASNIDTKPATFEEEAKGREPILKLLEETGTDIDLETLRQLPKWTTIQQLYGHGPVIIGKETCPVFRETIPPDQAYFGVAGFINSGTNLLSMYMQSNCRMPYNKGKHGNNGMEWQIPWGKHVFADQKWNNTAKYQEKANKTNFLPAVLVKDPYSWMQSMCHDSYNAHWKHTDKHCPNLVPDERDFDLVKKYKIKSKTIPVRMDWKAGRRTNHDSLATLWSEWYRQYYDVADYPRVMVRYEDLLFYPQQVIGELCDCVGGVPLSSNNFTYITGNSKWGIGHELSHTNMVSAMIKYGNPQNRLKGLSVADLKLAHEVFDDELMHVFQYNQPLNGQMSTVVSFS